MKTNVTFDPLTLEDKGTDCITLDGFSNALHKLLNAAWGESWGTYSEEEPTGNTPDELPAPHITFALEQRVVADEFKAFRSKTLGTFPDPDNPGFGLEKKLRIFHCEVSWRCWHKTNRQARLMSKKLEWFLEHYVGYFKEHGLMQLKFSEEAKPKVDDSFRQKIPSTTLVYEVWLQEIEVIRHKLLYDLQIKIQPIPTPTNQEE